MRIRKTFKFENAHIVRDCSTLRCSQNLHGHSYEVEVILESNYLDKAGMVYDFGLMKLHIKEIIDSFDHAITLYNGDSADYIDTMKKHSKRWILLPVNPSAEQFSRVFFLIIDKLLHNTKMQNSERDVALQSVIVHETKTGYAQCFKDDAYSALMGTIVLNDIEFSPQVQSEWSDTELFEKILSGSIFINPGAV
ncbi:MAG: 6-pyruvoyl trahydropterin synthase family protein [Campylobacterota bacterium]